MLDVLVVGAGPTGLTMVGELLRHGIQCRVVDKLAAPTKLSKAIAVHARTLEIFETLGLCEEFLAAGVKLRGAHLYSRGERIADVTFDDLETRYPFVLAIPQDDTEAILAAHVKKLGVTVERGIELTDLSQDETFATATLRHPDGTEEKVQAKYVVGCDGAHSKIRKAIGETFEGNAYDDKFILADVKADWDLPRDRLTTFFSDNGLLAIFPLPRDRFRLIATDPPTTARAEGWNPTLEEMQEITRLQSGLTVTLSDPIWLASFRINCRQVKEYRHGHVFLCGDAAHIHSPAGGQGMNTGMQDAHNLAWKLALALRGDAAVGLLDSYGTERHAVGVALLRGTDFATRVATLRSPVARGVRDRVARFASQLEVVQHRMGRTVAELDLSYQRSPIVAEHRTAFTAVRVGAGDSSEVANVTAFRQFAAAPLAGARAPDGHVTVRGETEPRRLYEILDTKKHSLLLFDGRASTDAGYENLIRIAARVRKERGALMNVYIIVPSATSPAALAAEPSVLLDPDGDLEHRYGAAAECLYVIRPDLYVGYRSQPADEKSLFHWMTSTFAN